MASKKELKALITLAGKVDPSLQSALMKASKQTMKVSNDAKKAATNMNKSSSGVKDFIIGNLAARGIAKVGEGMLTAGKNGVSLASDLTEVQNVVDVSFGKNANKINEWSQKALQSYGLSELGAKKYNGTLGAMLKSSGLTGKEVLKMSQNLTGLSGDFASFYNLQNDEAFDKIRSGISGETEPLKQLGINMSVANLEAYALSKGITKSYKDMNQASQTALRYSYLMNVSKDAQGDFARTQGTFANQVKLLKTNFEQLSAKLMSNLIPALTKGAQATNKFISNIDVNKVTDVANKVFKDLGYAIGWVKDNMNWLIPVVSGLVVTLMTFKILTKISKWLDGATLATKLFAAASNLLKANPIFLIAAALGALVAIFIVAYKNCETFRNAVNRVLSKIGEFGKTVLSNLVPALQSMYEWFSTNILPILQQIASFFIANILPILKTVASAVADIVVVAFNTLSSILQELYQNVLVPLFGFFTSVILPILQFVGTIVLWLWQNILAPLATFLISVFKGAFEVALPFIGDLFSTVFTAIGGVINAATQIFSGLIDFITGVFTGNWGKAWSGVKKILTGIWNGLGAILKAPINAGIDAVNGLIRGFNKVAKVKIPVIGTIGITIPEIPKFAKGGIATGPSIFGEVPGKPEMAIPLQRSPRSLGLLNQTAKILGASSTNYNDRQPIIFTYAPTYNGGNSTEIGIEFEKHKDVIKQMIEEIIEDDRRVSFG